MLTKYDNSIIWLSLAGLMLLLIGSFSRYFDISDEGIYLYLMQWGDRGIFVSPFYLLMHPIGALFDHQLIGYRWLSLLSITAASGYLGYQAGAHMAPNARYYIMGACMIAGLFNLGTLATFSYNTLASVASYLWVASLLAISRADQRWLRVHLVLLGVAIYLACMARPPQGAILLLTTPCALWAFSHLLRCDLPARCWILSMGVLMGLLALFATQHHTLIMQLLLVYSANLESSHTMTIPKILFQIVGAVSDQKLLLLAIASYALSIWPLRLTTKWSDALRYMTMLLLAMGALTLLNIDFTQHRIQPDLKACATFFLVFNGLMFLHGCLHMRKKNLSYELQRGVVFIPLCMIAALASGLGSNSNIMDSSSLTMGLFLVMPLCVCLRTVEFRGMIWFVRLIMAWLSLIALTTFYQNYYVAYYRASGWNHQTALLDGTMPLHGVRLEPEFTSAMTQLKHQLHDAGFDPNLDRVFAYPDMPGVLVALQARAFGMPWMVTGYPRIDISNCTYLLFEPTSAIRYVYVVQSAEISPALTSCLYDKLTPAEGFARKTSSIFYHHRNQQEQQFTIEGPYSVMAAPEIQ